MRTLIKKKNLNYTDHINHLLPFLGVGDINIDNSDFNDIKARLGKPEKDFLDERQNRIIDYPDYGLMFKFLKILNNNMKNPLVSFITVKKPFFNENSESIYPGMDKERVYAVMGNNKPKDICKSFEIWENDDEKKMKLVYDTNDKLNMIIIF